MSASAAAAMSSRRVQAASVPNSGSSSNGSSVGSSSAAATPTLRRGHSLDDSLPPAEEQGRYERMRVLGRGAFGAVTLVKDSTDSHLYAMKTLNWSEKEETRKAAMVEISLLRKLKHPFVVNLYDTFVSSDGRLVCMAMTYCESGDLSKVIMHAQKSKVPLVEKQVLSWFAQICLGVHYLQRDWSILHRDIKPNNIFLLDSKKYVKIGDFGLARTIDEGADEKIKAEVGTPYYTSPEMCSSKPYGYPSDVWSLGVVLYEMLALQVPFHSRDVVELVQQVISAKPPPLPKQYSPEVGRLVNWLLQKDPLRRPTLIQLLGSSLLKRYVQPLVKGYRPLHLPERQRRSEVRDLELQVAFFASLGGDVEIPDDVEEGAAGDSGSLGADILPLTICAKCSCMENSDQGNVGCAKCSCLPSENADPNNASHNSVESFQEKEELLSGRNKLIMSWAQNPQAAFALDDADDDELGGEVPRAGGDDQCDHELNEDLEGNDEGDALIDHLPSLISPASQSPRATGLPGELPLVAGQNHSDHELKHEGGEMLPGAETTDGFLCRGEPRSAGPSSCGVPGEPSKGSDQISHESGDNTPLNAGLAQEKLPDLVKGGAAALGKGESEQLISQEPSGDQEGKLLTAVGGSGSEPIASTKAETLPAGAEVTSPQKRPARRSMKSSSLVRRGSSKSKSPARRRHSAEASPDGRRRSLSSRSPSKSPRQKSFSGVLSKSRRSSVNTEASRESAGSTKNESDVLCANPPPRRKKSKSPPRLRKRRSTRGGLTSDPDIGSSTVQDAGRSDSIAEGTTVSQVNGGEETARSADEQEDGATTPRSLLAAELKMAQRLSDALTFASQGADVDETMQTRRSLMGNDILASAASGVAASMS